MSGGGGRVPVVRAARPPRDDAELRTFRAELIVQWRQGGRACAVCGCDVFSDVGARRLMVRYRCGPSLDPATAEPCHVACA